MLNFCLLARFLAFNKRSLNVVVVLVMELLLLYLLRN